MPFTFSHPAIILPATYLPEKYYSLSALIVGSMTPDFEYFIRMKDYSRYSHSLSGALWFDVPLGLIILFVFHNVVRYTLIAYLPFNINVRLSKFQNFNWNKYFVSKPVVVLVSLIIGIASHLFWDSFTHDGEFFSNAIPVLKDNFIFFNHGISGAAIFQYISSFFGGIIVLIAILKLPEGRNTKKNKIAFFWLLVSLITISVVTVKLYVDTLFNQYDYGDIIVTAISGDLIGIICLTFFYSKKNKPRAYHQVSRIRERNN